MSAAEQPREYRFLLDAFTPATIPLSRLSQYLGDLARMMGHDSGVHLARIEEGSTVPVIRVEWESEPKVRERIRAVRFNEGPAEGRRAYREINKRLVEDNANGILVDPDEDKIIEFQGRDAANQLEFGPIVQTSFFQGIPIKIGGEGDPVPIHLEDGEARHIISAPRRIAKQLAPFLFTTVVRVEGKGRWIRNRMGEWDMLSFYSQSFDVLSDDDLASDLDALRAAPAGWKTLDDPLGELRRIRGGNRPQ